MGDGPPVVQEAEGGPAESGGGGNGERDGGDEEGEEGRGDSGGVGEGGNVGLNPACRKKPGIIALELFRGSVVSGKLTRIVLVGETCQALKV